MKGLGFRIFKLLSSIFSNPLQGKSHVDILTTKFNKINSQQKYKIHNFQYGVRHLTAVLLDLYFLSLSFHSIFVSLSILSITKQTKNYYFFPSGTYNIQNPFIISCQGVFYQRKEDQIGYHCVPEATKTRFVIIIFKYFSNGMTCNCCGHSQFASQHPQPLFKRKESHLTASFLMLKNHDGKK